MVWSAVRDRGISWSYFLHTVKDVAKLADNLYLSGDGVLGKNLEDKLKE